VYPTPLADIAEAVAGGYYLRNDPAKYGPLIWPEGRPQDELEILVAGCGANEAAVIAYNNPRCPVLGIDLSSTSLAHAEYLKGRHRLDNLRLEQCDLRSLRGDQQFDYIICSGVLHHLQDPGEGLRALGAALKPTGAAFLMLYGRAARAGVYLMQEVFRQVGAAQDEAGLELVRDTLASLPANHYVHTFTRRYPAKTADTDMVDTFLHVQDRAYSVTEALELVRSNRLCFQTWVDQGAYSLENLKPDSLLVSAARSLPIEEQWAIVEATTLLIDKHQLIVCRPEREARACAIDFADGDWLNYFPVRHPWFRFVADPDPATGVVDVVRESLKFNVDFRTAMLLQAATGRRSIREALGMSAFTSIPWEPRLERGRRIYERMWRNGHMFFSRVPLSD
jgi:SAM-dependent methyltransferase